jgi:hypothetical protein
MEEGNSIDMAGIPLITAEGATVKDGAVEGAEGGGIEAGQDGDVEQGAEAARDEGVERTVPTEENRASDVERVAVAEHAEPTVDASLEADAANAEGAAHMSVEQVGEATHGSSGGKADDEVHAAELEAALLAVSSPGREANADAEPVETGPSSATVPRPRSEGLRFQRTVVLLPLQLYSKLI